MAGKDHIGTHWLEHDGPVTVKCEIIGKVKSSTGNEYYAVEKTYRDGTKSRTQDLIRLDEVEKEVALRTRKYEADAKSRGESAVRQAAEKSKLDDDLGLDGFVASMTAMQRGKAQKTLLEKGIRVNGKTYNKLRDAVRDLVAKGYIVDDKDHLINPSTDGWLKLGTIAVAYADFLIKSGKRK